jgi:predicted RNA-binding protein with PUA-like domain
VGQNKTPSSVQTLTGKHVVIQKYWFLQANPKLYDVEGALAHLDQIWWRIPQHTSDVHIGDVVMIWRSGKNAGIVGVGRVAEEPQDHQSNPAEAAFIRSSSMDSTPVPRALVLVRPSDFVPKSRLLDLDLLRSHLIIRAPMGTVFPVSDAEWEALSPLLPSPPGEDSSPRLDGSAISAENPNDVPEVVEEQYAGEGTGVELEKVGDSDTPEMKPWDPEKIRVTTKNFSLRNVLDMIDDDALELAPDFQRNRVWKRRQKSRLIESLLLQIPLPAFYFAEDEDGLLRVVDGLQRLSTIHSFVREEGVVLRDLEYLTDEDGKHFRDLSQALQRRLYNAQIVVHVIDPSTPDDVKYDIFKRINTGGEPLNAMEIRHCMSRQRSRDFLRRCTTNQSFDAATGGFLRDHVRMQDREAVLRFMAFRLLDGDIELYDEFGSLERLLDWAVKRIDNPDELSDEDLETLFADFQRSMNNARIVFGKHAFRKWPASTNRLAPINRALFESWGVVLADFEPESLSPHSDFIVAKTRELMDGDQQYLTSISAATGDPNRVRHRFSVPRQILTEARV